MEYDVVLYIYILALQTDEISEFFQNLYNFLKTIITWDSQIHNDKLEQV